MGAVTVDAGELRDLVRAIGRLGGHVEALTLQVRELRRDLSAVERAAAKLHVRLARLERSSQATPAPGAQAAAMVPAVETASAADVRALEREIRALRRRNAFIGAAVVTAAGAAFKAIVKFFKGGGAS